MSDPPTWETKTRFAERWGVSAKTVSRWAESGLLGGDAVKVVNGRDYIRRDAVPAEGKAKRDPLDRS
jgi:predicted site-specific integrase-resolvase